MLILCMCWFASAVILYSTAFLFRVREFDCQAHGLTFTKKQCTTHVCKLP